MHGLMNVKSLGFVEVGGRYSSHGGLKG